MSQDRPNDAATGPPGDRRRAAGRSDPRERLAITGAEGFIARRFLELYAHRFDRVVGLVRTFPVNPVDGVEYRAGDVSLAHSMRFGLRDCHLVAHLAYDHRNRARAVAATGNVLAACRAADVRRLVHVSTVAVYDQTVAGALDESTRPARWRDPYIESKLRIERRLASAWREGYRRILIVQPTNVYGPGGSWTEHALRACRAGAVELPHGGEGRCNAVYVDDVCQALFLSLTGRLDDEGIAPPRYLINGPDDVSWRDFFEAHGEALAAAGLIDPDAENAAGIDPASVGSKEPAAASAATAAGATSVAAHRGAAADNDRPSGCTIWIRPTPTTHRFADDPRKNLAMALACHPLPARLLFTALSLRPAKRSGAGHDPLAVFHDEPPAPPQRFSGMGRLYLATRCRADTGRAARDLGYAPEFDLRQGTQQIAAALRAQAPRIASPPPRGAVIDLQKEGPPAVLHRRVCIIGTGLGGGALAANLLRRGDDLIILEAGNGGALSSTHSSEESNVGLDNAGLDFGLAIYRDISLGGSGNAWRGLCSPRDAIDYQARDWIPQSGWPIGEAELDAAGHEAAALLHIDDYGLFADQSTIDGAAERAQDFRFRRDEFDLKHFLQTRPPRSFRGDLLDACGRSGGPLLLQNAPALELVTDAAGSRVEKALLQDGAGRTHEVTADVFVLCCGALETPRLLLNSRPGKHGEHHRTAGDRESDGGRGRGPTTVGNGSDDALGNQYGLVGRYLMDHPMVAMGQVRLRRPRTAPLFQALQLSAHRMIKAGLVMRAEAQRRHRLPNHSVFLLPSLHRGFDDRYERARRALITARRQRLSLADVFTVATNPNVIQWALSYVSPLPALFRYADLFFIAEQTPHADSRVDLSEQRDRYGYPMARARWQVSDGDVESLVRFNELLLAAFPESDYEVTYRRQRADIRPGITSAAHFCGTARMGGAPSESVVDGDLKVWGIDNLYVCDTSVLPTSGNANPGLGIVTLALRLARHLAHSGAGG